MTVSGYNSLTPADSITQSDTQQALQSSRSIFGSASPVTDQTKLSADQQQTQQLQDSLNSLPETRSDRVAAAQNAIQNGQLPSNGQIANAMMKELGA
jgi:flagellar biosynthesis anti-sigma factor FlgM